MWRPHVFDRPLYIPFAICLCLAVHAKDQGSHQEAYDKGDSIEFVQSSISSTWHDITSGTVGAAKPRATHRHSRHKATASAAVEERPALPEQSPEAVEAATDWYREHPVVMSDLMLKVELEETKQHKAKKAKKTKKKEKKTKHRGDEAQKIPSILWVTGKWSSSSPELDNIQQNFSPEPPGTKECMWRQTGGCHPNGGREPDSDKPCKETLSKEVSGFCDCDGDGSKGLMEAGYDCGVQKGDLSIPDEERDGKCSSVCHTGAAVEDIPEAISLKKNPKRSHGHREGRHTNSSVASQAEAGQTNGLSLVGTKEKEQERARLNFHQWAPEGAKIYYFTDEDMTKSVGKISKELEDQGITSRGRTAASAYSNLRPGAFRADLWRCMVLWKYGGVYLDANLKLTQKLEKWVDFINDELVLVSDAGAHNGKLPAYWNAMMAVTPQSVYMERAIQVITHNVHDHYYGDDPLAVTGPIALYNALESLQALGLNYKDNLRLELVWKDKRVMNFKTQEMVAYKDESLHETTNSSTHYAKMYRMHAIYCDEPVPPPADPPACLKAES